jgi:hypothetical protein
MLISRELIDKAVPFPNEIPHDYWLAIVAASESKLIYGDFITLRYRQHTSNITANRKVPPLQRIFSKNAFNQQHVLNTIYVRLTLKDEFLVLLDEAIFLYAADNKPVNKIKKIVAMFFIYQEVNFNNSMVLLLYRIVRFVFLVLFK